MSGYNDHWGSISKCGLILQLLIIRRSLFLMNQNNTALPIYSNQLTRMCWFFLLNQNHTVNQCSSSNIWTNDCSETVIFSELKYKNNQCYPVDSWINDSHVLVIFSKSKLYSQPV